MLCLISFERCQSSCEGTRNKWTLKKSLVHGRIRTTNTARPPDYKSTFIKLYYDKPVVKRTKQIKNYDGFYDSVLKFESVIDNFVCEFFKDSCDLVSDFNEK